MRSFKEPRTTDSPDGGLRRCDSLPASGPRPAACAALKEPRTTDSPDGGLQRCDSLPASGPRPAACAVFKEPRTTDSPDGGLGGRDSLPASGLRPAACAALLRRLVYLAGATTLCSGLLLAQFEPPQSQVPHQETPQDQDQAPTIKVDVNLVNVLFSVKAKKGGALIPNLEQNDFTVFEDGKQQKIQRFTRETDLPITLGLLIDVSLSQENLVDVERQAASAFFDSVIRKKDEAFVISFGKDIQLLQDMTSSARQLSNSMNDLRPDPEPAMMGRNIPVNTGPVPQTGTPKGTLLYDAIYLAANEKLSGEVGRKALILITDGDDMGSTYDRRAAIQAAQKADAIIFSIYYVDRAFYSRGGFSFGGSGEGELRKMSDETGGQVFTVSGKHPLNEVFKEIQDELRNQYSIAYAPDNASRDGGFRHLEIKVDKPEDRVQSRNGYYATPNGGQ